MSWQKWTLLSLLCSFCYFNSQAQESLGFNYQAVARDADGELIANQLINLRFQLLEGGVDGDLVFQERHSVSTNTLGLVQVIFGNGEVEVGNFSQLDWAEQLYYLRVELNGQPISTTPFQAVPYAKIATEMEVGDLEDVSTTAAEIGQILVWDGQEWSASGPADPDPTNELQQLVLQNDEITLSKGGGSVNLSPLLSPWELNDADIYREGGRLGLGTSTPEADFHLTGGSFLVGDAFQGNGGKFFLEPSTGAFRAGIATSNSWDEDSLGVYSFATGSGTLASGWFGSAHGISTRTPSYAGFSIGRFNIGYSGSPLSWSTSDAVFEVGIGSSDSDRRNAMTIWKNGKVSINSRFGVSPSSPIVRIDNDEEASRSISIIQQGGNFFGSEGIYIQLANSFTDDPNSNITTATTGLTSSVAGLDGRTTGVFAGASGSSSKDYATFGLRATARNNNGGGIAYGVFAEADGNSSGAKYAGYFDGDVFSAGNYLPSDARLKTGILAAENVLEIILSLPVKTYSYAAASFPQMKLPEGKRTGFLAQDLARFLPELVKMAVHPGTDMSESGRALPGNTETHFQAVDYAGLVPYLVKAIQEQQEQIDSQRKEINRLKKELEGYELLESRLSELEELIKGYN